MRDYSKYHFLEQIYPDLLDDVGALIQKIKIAQRFNDIEVSPQDLTRLTKAKELCELAIIEHWENQEQSGFKSLCATYFDIASSSQLPQALQDRVFELIKIISFGYLGESWHWVKRYLENNYPDYNLNNPANEWNMKILHYSFAALCLIVKKDSWRDLQEAGEHIATLRELQSAFETNYLDQVNVNQKISGASELVSLYHLAKAIETLSTYILKGEPNDAAQQVSYHLQYAGRYANESGNFSLALLVQYFEPFAEKLIKNSLWYVTRGVNSRVSQFNEFITKRGHDAIFELLYPQREALVGGGLMDDAYDSVVVNLPTSSGKTLIAEYRILKALNQFADSGGWVAYLAPTRSLANQITLQLKKDLGPIGIRIEKLSAAIELDGFEESLIDSDRERAQFDVLVTTYEKMHLLVRQGVGTTEDRPLVLAVVDEAHNLEEDTRGIGLELLLTTIKKDCRRSNFLLMTPDVINAHDVSDWLGGDRGHFIQMGLSWWQPNERIIGALMVEGEGRDFKVNLKTLFTQKGTFNLADDIELFKLNNAPVTKSKIYGSVGVKKDLSALVASKISDGVTIVLVRSPKDTIDVAEKIYNESQDPLNTDEDVELVRKYIVNELGDNFPLARLLARRIAVHSSGLPEDIRFLIEDLMANQKLDKLVATTTIAQGINFPVSSIIMASYSYPYKKMPTRDFWNMAGRVGRAGQNSLGYIGIALKNDHELLPVTEYVVNAADDLRSQMVGMIQKALENPEIRFEQWLFREPKWSSVLQYISHLFCQTRELNAFLSRLEIDLQNTLGYKQLNTEQKNYLATNIREYVTNMNLGHASLSDQTGFSTVSIRNIIGNLQDAEIDRQDWNSRQLFSHQPQSLQKLVEIMFETPEISKQMKHMPVRGTSLDHSSISGLISDWVNGQSIETIASRYFPDSDTTTSIDSCIRALHKNIANAAAWGLAAIQKMPNCGLIRDNLSATEKKQFFNLPAMIHYGVNTDEAILMRINNVPRSIANKLGELYAASIGRSNIFSASSSQINQWLSELSTAHWSASKESEQSFSGADYKKIWRKISGN